MDLSPGVRTFAAYAAAAMAGILGLIALNVAADKTGWSGLVTLRNYATRSNA